MATQRTAGELVFVALVVAMTVALGAAIVWYAIWIVRPVVNDVSDMFSCSDSEWAVAKDMPKDAAVSALADSFNETHAPVYSCDPDDGTAATDLAFRTEFARAEALKATEIAMASNGWHSEGHGNCFTKGNGEQQLWADVAVIPRRGGGSLLRVGIVNANYCGLLSEESPFAAPPSGA